MLLSPEDGLWWNIKIAESHSVKFIEKDLEHLEDLDKNSEESVVRNTGSEDLLHLLPFPLQHPAHLPLQPKQLVQLQWEWGVENFIYFSSISPPPEKRRKNPNFSPEKGPKGIYKSNLCLRKGIFLFCWRFPENQREDRTWSSFFIFQALNMFFSHAEILTKFYITYLKFSIVNFEGPMGWGKIKILIWNFLWVIFSPNEKRKWLSPYVFQHQLKNGTP